MVCFLTSTRLPHSKVLRYSTFNAYHCVHSIYQTYKLTFLNSGGQQYQRRYEIGCPQHPPGCTGATNYLHRLANHWIHKSTVLCTHRCTGLGYHCSGQ